MLLEYANGNFDVPIAVSEVMDDEEAILGGIMMLGEELQENMVNRTYFSQIFNSVSDMIFVLDEHSVILDINKSAREFLGSGNSYNLHFKKMFDVVWKDLNSKGESFESEQIINGTPYSYSVKAGTIKSSRFEKNSLLVVMRDITEQKNIEANIFSTVVNTQEEERQRVSMDLHDSIGQKLTALKLYNSLLRKKLGDLNDSASKTFAEIDIILDESILELRAICFNLTPDSFQRSSLSDIIENNIKKFTLNSDTEIKVDISGEEPELEYNLKVASFRIIQEFINNSLKHAEAETINIQVKYLKNKLKIALKDDGKGFNIEKALISSSGNGVKNIISRIKAYKGDYQFNSKKGAETVLNINFDLKRE